MKVEDFLLNEWNYVSNSRSEPDVLIGALKKRIDYYGDFEFNDEYTKFRRIVPFSEFIKGVPRGVSYTIEHRNQDEVHFDYSHLEVDIKTYSSEDWKKKVGRHV